ncbi:TolC family protein [Persephonella sp.]
MKKYIALLLIVINITYGITLEEAIVRAKNYLPLYYQNLSDFKSYFYRYRSAISPFFPRLSYSFSYTKYRDINPVDYFYRNHSLTVRWDIYDSGFTYFSYKSAYLNYKSSKFSFDEAVLDIVYNVKYAYLKCAANKEILKFRKIQFKAAEIDYQLALDKRNLGLVKKSDVLQAKVRYENARYSLVQAENEYRKSVAELNSLLGFPLDRETDVDTTVLDKYTEDNFPDFDRLKEIAFKKRPQIKSYKYLLESSKENTKRALFQYTPSISLYYSLNKNYNSLSGKDSYGSYGLTLNWIIFSGLKRYYDYLYSKEKERYSRYALKELKRKIELNLYKRNEDLKTSYNKLKVAQTILEQAQLNYEQVLGEYKAGTSDIVALLTAESALASAHETYVQSLLDVAVTKVSIERELGVENINTLWGGE